MALVAEYVDTKLDNVARLDVLRRLETEADTCRSAGGNDVPGQHSHEPTEVIDDMRVVENEVRGITNLLFCHSHRARIGDYAGLKLHPAWRGMGRAGCRYRRFYL
jgi:hypothetical protein